MEQNEIMKTTPPVGVSTLSLLGVPLSDWVYIVTIIYVLLQIVVLVKKNFGGRKNDTYESN